MTEETKKPSTRKRSHGSKAVEVAKSKRDKPELGTVITTKTGVRIRVVPVAIHLIDEIMYEIKDPEVPMEIVSEKGLLDGEPRRDPNPFNKQYLKDVADAEHERGIAVSDALIWFGVDLVDGLPEDDTWLKKLRWFERRGKFSLDGFDLDDEIDLEFVYKKYFVVSGRDIVLIGSASGMNEAEVEGALRGFQGDDRSSSDSSSEVEESAQD